VRSPFTFALSILAFARWPLRTKPPITPKFQPFNRANVYIFGELTVEFRKIKSPAPRQRQLIHGERFHLNGKNLIFAYMGGQDDLLAKLRETLEQQGIDSFHILEDLVPVEVQMEYFRYFERLRRENEPFMRDEEVSLLFSPDASVERKKRSLTLLASIPDVSAYRSIETYHSSPLEPELAHWSSMALVSSRIILSSYLSGQQQVYISSGLGGHGKKLRFFAVLTTTERQPFTDLQREIVNREFTFQLEQADVVIEKFETKENYFTIQMLFAFDKDAKSILDAAVNECNQYGNFLDTKYLFTNVKVLNDREIESLLAKR